MVKRSVGFFKICFFIFCILISAFLILFSLTNIRDFVSVELCFGIFCVSITILPFIIETILYGFGKLTNGIKSITKEEVLSYSPMKNSLIPYAILNDDGCEKHMFFCEKGKIVLIKSKNSKLEWNSDVNEIELKSTISECNAFYKMLYGVTYDHIQCVVKTTLKDPKKQTSNNEKKENDTSEAPLQATKIPDEQATNEKTCIDIKIN